MALETQKRGRKFDQVLDGAMQVFIEHGFEGASVDEIAKVAGVSKATLYSYFPDKAQLFSAVAKHRFQTKADRVLTDFDFDDPPSVILVQAGKLLLDTTLSEFDCSVHRIAVSEAVRFPQIAKDYYESGYLLARHLLMAYFQHAIKRGELLMENQAFAADQFVELCKVDLCTQHMMNLRHTFSDEEKAFVVAEAVKMFMARYGAK